MVKVEKLSLPQGWAVMLQRMQYKFLLCKKVE